MKVATFINLVPRPRAFPEKEKWRNEVATFM